MPQTLDYSKRSRTTQADILVAFRDRLRAACPGCNDLTCFICDQPIPQSIPGAGTCVTISMGDGTFDQQLFLGAGAATLNEETQIIISVLTQIVLDRIPQAERALLDTSRGLVAQWKYQILRTILLADPDDGAASKPWEPASGDKPLLRDQIRPIVATAPADVPGKPGWIGAQINFAISFDWELGAL